eukprot:6491754-Amphidinium_carterae.1
MFGRVQKKSCKATSGSCTASSRFKAATTAISAAVCIRPASKRCRARGCRWVTHSVQEPRSHAVARTVTSAHRKRNRHLASSLVTNAATAAVSIPRALKHSRTKQRSSNTVRSRSWSRMYATGRLSNWPRWTLPAAVMPTVSHSPPPVSLASDAVTLTSIGALRLICNSGKWQTAIANSALHARGSSCERTPHRCKACHIRWNTLIASRRLRNACM